MKHSAKQFIAAALLATLGAVAAAQTPPPYGAAAPLAPGANGARHEHQMDRFDPAKKQARRAERLAHIKQTLQITPAQDAVWNAWVASMQPPANWKRPDRAELARLPTPERIDRMRVLRAERMARMDRRADATKVFYAALSPEQKRVFDEQSARRGHHGGHHHQKG